LQCYGVVGYEFASSDILIEKASLYHVYIQQRKMTVTLMAAMSLKEIKRFLMQGTFTGKLATTKKDGSSHIVPIWFVLNDNHKDAVTEREKIGYDEIILTTNSKSVKARNIQRDNRVSICVDDQTPPFSYVVIYGTARIQHCEQSELLRFATKIAQRYMGKEVAELYGKRNSAEGEVLVSIKPTRIIAEKDIAGWD
jgi:PPOX class probable F420-dependent enzyme